MKILTGLTEFFSVHTDYTKRVFGLDLLRALAIIFVIMGHGGWILQNAHTNFPWIRLFNGVDLFFVLSGFLIGNILLHTFIDTESFNVTTIWKFWTRRWFRTLPNYYLILIVNIVLVYFGIIHEDFSQFGLKFFFFLQNFSQPLYGFFWESWSLSIEEWFYLLFPILLGILYFATKKWKFSKRYIFLIATCLFILAPFLLRLCIASHFTVDQFWLDVRINKVVIYRLDGIAFGLLCAYIQYYHPYFWHKIRNISFVIGLIICFFVVYYPWQPNDFSTKVFKILINSIGCALLLPKFDSMKTAPPKITKVFTHISIISYSMYLINLALVSSVIRDHFAPTNPVSAWSTYLLYWVIIIVASTLLYKYYELPFLKLRDKISPKSA